MKRIAASVGLVAIGAASIQGVYGQTSLSGDNSKSWSVSAALRGFYDDNIATAPSGPNKVGSYGFELNPSLQYSLPIEQGALALTYAYSLKRYDREVPGAASRYDQTHTFTGLFDHNFNERLRLGIQDSFVIGQEPDQLRQPDAAETAFNRISGNNIRNYGAITLNGEITPVFGLEGGYANAFFKYADRNDTFGASQSGLLDRLEHTIHLDARWKLQPETVAFVGYQFTMVDFTGDQPIGGVLDNGTTPMSSIRNSRSQYGYVGAEHNFLPNLSGAVRAGVRYTDNYNSPDGNTEWAPYAKANVHYAYSDESHADLGVSYDRSATDGFSANVNSIEHDADSAVVYASVDHRIMPNLYANLSGTFQYSTHNGGLDDGQSDRLYQAGVNVEYRFNRNLSASVGYNYDKLNAASSGSSFDRNRVYIGVKATY